MGRLFYFLAGGFFIFEVIKAVQFTNTGSRLEKQKSVVKIIFKKIPTDFVVKIQKIKKTNRFCCKKSFFEKTQQILL